MVNSITAWMLEIAMILFYNMLAKVFGHINTIPLVDEVDNFDRLQLKIGVRLIEIGPYVGTRLIFGFQLLFRLHNLRI